MQIHTIDLGFQGVRNAIAAYVVEGEDGLALVETGPGSTLENLVRGLTECGFHPGDVEHVFVTHCHLDHAGAAGWWAERGAKIYAHPKAARHIIDPSRLLESATSVYGVQKMEELWGEMIPAPEENVVIVEDGDEIEIGDLAFVAWDTPGHARHHHSWTCLDVAFTGDVAGVRMPGQKYISLASAPPQFDPPAYRDSIDRLAEGGFRKLYLTHFGEVNDPASHLARYREIVLGSSELVRAHRRNGAEPEALQKSYANFCRERASWDGLSEESWLQYEAANPTPMCADGIRLYWEQEEGLS